MKTHLHVTFRGQEYFGQESGYVFLESSGRPGTLGQQVMDHGTSCMTTPTTAEALLRKLRNKHRRQQRQEKGRP